MTFQGIEWVNGVGRIIIVVGEEEGKPLKGPFDGMAVVSRSFPNCCNCSPEGGTQQNRFSQVVSE